MEKICYIVGGGECRKIEIENNSFVIAADGGLRHLEAAGIKADIIMGDFDSLGYVPEGENVIRFPKEKDDTDISIGVKEGLKRGFRVFVIFGGTGGRPDHTYANYQLLSFIAENGGRGFLCGEAYTASVIKDSFIEFEVGSHGLVSVFSVSEKSEGITLQGLKYSLENAELSSNFPLGVSNEFTGEKARISVKKGSILVMWEDTAKCRPLSVF